MFGRRYGEAEDLFSQLRRQREEVGFWFGGEEGHLVVWCVTCTRDWERFWRYKYGFDGLLSRWLMMGDVDVDVDVW